ncbi:MAG TPA: hypothetical protein PK411_14490 [Mesotoga infera]|nr:hypothetical protein [Mesotoga infera]HRV03134.1 hypothetical protein [Mesotoga sp.]
MKRLLRLFFLLLFLAATTLVLSSSRYVTSVNVHSFLYEEETGYRIDVIYPGPQVFWTVITLTDTKNFLKRIPIVDQLTSVYLDNIPSKMDLKVESFSGGQAFFGSVSLSRKSARSDLSILLSRLGIPSAVVLFAIGLAITVVKLRGTDAISRKSGLVALWWAVLIVAVSAIGVSYYVGLFPLDPVISQKGALSFPEDRPGALPEAEYTFLKETFHKLLDGVPSIIDRYYKLVNTLEEVEGGPIQNEEKSRTISRIHEELEKIEPTIYRIVEALQTIKFKVINGQITSGDDRKAIEYLLFVMDEINKEPPNYSF